MLFTICNCSLLTLNKMSVLLLIFIICAPTILSQDLSSPQHYCFVQSPSDFSIFNFTTIQHDHNDSTIRLNDDEHLRIHFCRPLKDPCNGKQDYAVCLHEGSKEIGAGKEPPKVAIEYGKIMFKYTGDKCNATHNYTVDIEMKCDFSMKEKVAVDLDIVYNRDQCNFQMAIETSAACAKRRQTTCDLTTESGYYNLSPLMSLHNNYKLKLNKTLSIILNVCHSLIYGQHYQQCDHETMVCLVDETNTENTSYTRLGNINNDVHISAVNGSVYLDLTSDTPCDKEDAVGLKTIKTTIEFVCREDDTNKSLKYRSGLGTCHYKFRWLTRAACSEDILTKLSEVNHEPCKIMDPLYRQTFDLSMLEGKVYYVKSSNTNAEYQFSVCSPLRRSNCTNSETGICKYMMDKKLGVSKGLANTNLTWRRGTVLLNYTDGMACGNNRRSYTTIIFNCGIGNSLLIDDQDPCATVITWSTYMVCNRRCATPDFKFNVYKLTRHSHNYLVRGENNDTYYHINVCEPLLDLDEFNNCTNGTGICKVVIDEKGNRISEVNLGRADFGLHKAENGRLYMKYLNGSVCEEDSSKRISAEITFTCDIEAHSVGQILFALNEPFFMSDAFFKFLVLYQGNPELKSYNDCKYEFLWRTGIICPKDDIGLSRQCLMGNRIELFDLAHLVENSLFNVNRNESTGYFNVSVCGETNQCNGTFVCDNRPHYGEIKKPKPTPSNKLVAFKFANETQCKNNIFYNSVIKLWCNIWDGLAEPFLLKEGECSIKLEWAANNTVCKPKENVKEEEKEKKEVKEGNVKEEEKEDIVKQEEKGEKEANFENIPENDTSIPANDTWYHESISATPKNVILSMASVVALAGLILLILHYRYEYRRIILMNTIRYYTNRILSLTRRRAPTEEMSVACRF